MKKIFLLALTSCATLICPKYAGAQGMAVNTSGSAAASSAMLDVSSTTQGVLVPRMTAAQRAAISSPATGLLVYQTDGTTGFYYYSGSAWTSLSSPTGTISGGDLTGSYPSPSIATGAVTGSKIASATITGSNIASNTITTANLPAGATSTTFLRGDNTWATPSGSSGGGTIGGGITSYTISGTTTLQSVNVSGTTNRLIVFDENNNSFFSTNSFNLSVTLGAASAYTAGTLIRFRVINSVGGYYGTITFNSSSSSFINSVSSPASGSVTFTYCNGATLVSDGVSKWYLVP